MKGKKKVLKRIFSLYNIAVFICVLIIAISLFIIFMPQKEAKIVKNGIEIVQSDIKENEILQEKDAKELAIKQFKMLGEKNVKNENLEILKITRQKEEYYFISSKENTVEISLKGGKITMINSMSL